MGTLTPGPLEIDRGTFSSVGGNLGEGSRGIQRHRPFRYTDTFTGRAGTLVIRQDARLVSVGGGYEIGTGTWKVVRGTGYYQGVTGEGLGFAVLAHPEWEAHPNEAAIHARYEGYLTTPDVPAD